MWRSPAPPRLPPAGTSFDRPTASGKKIHLSLMANPSHLEAVNTLVLGKVKAKQFYLRGEQSRGALGWAGQ